MSATNDLEMTEFQFLYDSEKWACDSPGPIETHTHPFPHPFTQLCLNGSQNRCIYLIKILREEDTHSLLCLPSGLLLQNLSVLFLVQVVFTELLEMATIDYLGWYSLYSSSKESAL